MTDLLKLLAFDNDDLAVLSAHAQDAVLKSEDIDYSAQHGRLLLPINRFAWEAPGARKWLRKQYERRRSVLHFDRVESLRSQKIDRSDRQQVLSLLAVEFTPNAADDPSGTITLSFSGGAAMVAQVECIEARLTDLGAAWATGMRPVHRS